MTSGASVIGLSSFVLLTQLTETDWAQMATGYLLAIAFIHALYHRHQRYAPVDVFAMLLNVAAFLGWSSMTDEFVLIAESVIKICSLWLLAWMSFRLALDSCIAVGAILMNFYPPFCANNPRFLGLFSSSFGRLPRRTADNSEPPSTTRSYT